MSLYNTVHGTNPLAGGLLAILGLDPMKIPRLRDCYLTKEHIVVHTRTGGGNRDFYDAPNEENTEGPWNTYLTEHPGYVRDEDAEFDCTYADFFFKFPEEYAEKLRELAEVDDTPAPAEKWKALFAHLESIKPGEKP